jgi:hypothetical protein
MSMTVIAVIVAAVVILLLIIGGGIIFFVVRKGKAKGPAMPAQQEASYGGAPAPGGVPAAAWSPPPAIEPEAQSWGTAPEAATPEPAPAFSEEPPFVGAELPVAEAPAWTPPMPQEPMPDPFPPVQPGIAKPEPQQAADSLAATLGPESYTTTPNVSAIPVSTVDPFATTPNVPVRPMGELVPAMLRAHDGSVIQLVRVQMRVGRHPECEIVIPTPGTSRNHAEFQCVNGAWLINDLNSGNGTFVNGVRVRTHQLASGDEVRVDQTKFWFTLGG